MLNIEFALDYEKLFNIFHHFPLLRSIKFNKCLEKFDNSFNDYKDSTSLTLEHESLEVIEFDTSHPIDERYLAFFFSYDNFPSLNKLILK